MTNQQPLVVIGASAGGLNALKSVLGPLPIDFPSAILVAQHLLPNDNNSLDKILNDYCQLPVTFAQNGAMIKASEVYLAPPNYHLRLNKDGVMMLSQDKKVGFSRPSIDVLFYSVVKLPQFKVTAIMLTGANNDGSKGAEAIQGAGGIVIVQDPETAEVATMPQAVIDLIEPDAIVWCDQIGSYLWDSLRSQN